MFGRSAGLVVWVERELILNFFRLSKGVIIGVTGL